MGFPFAGKDLGRVPLFNEINGIERAWLPRMNTTAHLVFASLICLLPLSAQDEPVVSKNALSVHTVERGNMPLRERATGSIANLQPPRAVVRLAGDNAARCEPGQSATIQIDPPRVIAGRVVKSSQENSETGGCEIALSEPLPSGTAIGKRVGALIQTGEMQNVVFFGRPADSSPNSEASVFVLEPGAQFARRATVRYGKISGALIQVLEGLSPGDRVIVTDMSKWARYPRVRIQ